MEASIVWLSHVGQHLAAPGRYPCEWGTSPRCQGNANIRRMRAAAEVVKRSMWGAHCLLLGVLLTTTRNNCDGLPPALSSGVDDHFLACAQS